MVWAGVLVDVLDFRADYREESVMDEFEEMATALGYCNPDISIGRAIPEKDLAKIQILLRRASRQRGTIVRVRNDCGHAQGRCWVCDQLGAALSPNEEHGHD